MYDAVGGSALAFCKAFGLGLWGFGGGGQVRGAGGEGHGHQVGSLYSSIACGSLPDSPGSAGAWEGRFCSRHVLSTHGLGV